MIGDGKKYHYLAVTNLSGLLQGNSSNHEGDFYCLNCFNSYTSKHTKNTKKYATITIAVVQKCLSGLKKDLKYNPGEKSLKAPFAIYPDLECLLQKE